MTEEPEHESHLLTYLIYGLLTLVIILTFFSQLFSYWHEQSDVQTCRKSVEMHASSHVYGIETIEGFTCPPKNMTVKEDDEEEIKRIIADEMAECFWKFGENKLELFGGKKVGINKFCALCSHVKFRGDAEGKEITDFSDFLTDEDVPPKYGEGSYADYLIGEPTDPDQVKKIEDRSTTQIYTDSDYGVIFVYSKDSYVHKVLTKAFGGALGASAGLVGGSILLLFPEPTFTKAAGVALISAAAGGGGLLVGEEVGAEKSADWQSAVIVIEYTPENLQKLDCTRLPVSQGNK